MENTEMIERFQDAHGANIDKLFWIAASAENSDLESFLSDLEPEDLQACFPESKYIAECGRGEIVNTLINDGYCGLVALVYVPEVRNIDYDEQGEPKSWSVVRGISRMGYVYSENLEDLAVQVENLAEAVFAEYIQEDKIKIAVRNAHPSPDTEVSIQD